MNALLLLGACLLLGQLASRSALFPAETPRGLNAWVLHIALPALILAKVPQLHPSWDLFFVVLSPWGVFLGACLVFPWVGRWRNWSRGEIGAVILTCGLGNTAFIGLAMIESLRGPLAVAPAVMADQLGSFIALSTGGIIVAATYSGAQANPKQILVRVLTFLPFLALILGLAVGQLGGWPPSILTILDRIGNSLVPLALFSVGFQFRWAEDDHSWWPVTLGLGWKLLLCPALALATGWVLQVQGTTLAVGVLQAAMAPMISAGLLAEQNQLAPQLARRIVGVGILLSLLTVPLWNLVLP